MKNITSNFQEARFLLFTLMIISLMTSLFTRRFALESRTLEKSGQGNLENGQKILKNIFFICKMLEKCVGGSKIEEYEI